MDRPARAELTVAGLCPVRRAVSRTPTSFKTGTTSGTKTLVAPYERDPRRWLEVPWINRYSGREYRLSSEPFGGYVRPGVVRPRSYRDVLRQYRANEEAKSLGPDGRPCRQETRGSLRRRHVRLRTLTHVGKESNSLEDAQTGLVEDLGEVVNEYDSYYSRVFVPYVIPVLLELGVRETARRTGHSVGAVSGVVRGTSRPRTAQSRRYLEAAALKASAELTLHQLAVPTDPLSAVRLYLDVRNRAAAGDRSYESGGQGWTRRC